MGEKRADDETRGGGRLQNDAGESERLAAADEASETTWKEALRAGLVGLLAFLFLFVPGHPPKLSDIDEGRPPTSSVFPAEGPDGTDEPSPLGAHFRDDSRAEEWRGQSEAPDEEASSSRIANSAFRIVVRRDDGSAAEGARVELMGSGLSAKLVFRTDSEGRIETPKLPPGFYELHAHHGSLVSQPMLGVQLHADRAKEIELTLRPGLRLEGEVVRLRDGAPVEGAHLSVIPDALSLIRKEAWSDAQGRFLLEGLPDGILQIYVEAEGYTRKGPLRIDPSAGAPRIELGLAASLEVVVRDDRGRPIEEAEVLLLVDAPEVSPSVVAPGDRLTVIPGPVPPIPPASSGVTSRSLGAAKAILASGESDANGRLLFTSLNPSSVQLRAEADRSTAALSEPIQLLPGRQLSTEITLREGGTLSIRVRDEFGAPVPDPRIRARREGDPFPLEIRGDENGEAELYGLEGAYAVQAFLGEEESAESELEIRIGERRTVELRFERRDAQLSGRVVDPRGFGIRSAAIELQAVGSGRNFAASAQSARDGTFAFEQLPPPPYSLRVTHPAYPELKTPQIERSGEIPPIVLSVGGAIRGTIVDARTGAGIRARLSIETAGGSFEARSNADGEFSVDRLPLGDAAVTFEAEGYLSAHQTLSIRDQERAASLGTVRLEQAAEVRGELVDRYGEPIFGATLSAEGVDGPSSDARAQSDEAGRFHLKGLFAGRVRLIARLRDGTRYLHRSALNLRSGELVDGVRFRLSDYAEGAPELPVANSTRLGVPVEVVDRGGAIEIGWIAEGSGASRAGLRVGDQILEIDGESLLIAAQARAALRVGEGERVTIRIRRGASTRLYEVMGERYSPR